MDYGRRGESEEVLMVFKSGLKIMEMFEVYDLSGGLELDMRGCTIILMLL